MEIPKDSDPQYKLLTQLYALNNNYDPTKHVFARDEISQIDDWLWLGGCDTNDMDPFDHFEQTTGKQVDAVISIVHPGDYKDWTQVNNKDRTVVQFADSKQVDPRGHWTYIAELLRYYFHQKKTVFIHCMVGISRSASSVIFYYQRYTDMNVVDAFKFVRSKRPAIHPNVGFIMHLSKVCSDK